MELTCPVMPYRQGLIPHCDACQCLPPFTPQCTDCGQENEATDDTCCACETARPAAASGACACAPALAAVCKHARGGLGSKTFEQLLGKLALHPATSGAVIEYQRVCRFAAALTDNCRSACTGGAGDDAYAGYVVGLVVSVEAVPKKDKLSIAKVRVWVNSHVQTPTPHFILAKCNQCACIWIICSRRTLQGSYANLRMVWLPHSQLNSAHQGL